ncbi:TetR/AcrR family transcriptional regulator [Spirillospora sp. NPDC048911]|uniref:TetR/AcrR family transcriptional regulator n=1 Tax=Spirillospora sp. NPDC048911 TaxID=3364527 RepID=UPI0037119F63
MQRSHARSNRARILSAARQELARDPEASLAEVARAAGVARRTLYGHFANRQALLDALAEEARGALEEAFAQARLDAPPLTALARMTLAAWGVGDRYRMLLSLARRDLGEARVREILTPARQEAASILERGMREGVFVDHLPAPVLAHALESLTLALVEHADAPDWPDPTGEAAAATVLMAAGVAPPEAHHHAKAAQTPSRSRLPNQILDGND